MKAQSILVPVDYTDVSHDALRFAMNLAHDLHSQVTVLHIEPKVTNYGIGIEPYVDLNREPDELLRELELNVSADMDASVACEFQVAIGEPTQRILEYAGMHDTDLIVMGTHGRSGISRWIMGSVAESVMRQAHCPVFIVKHNSHAETTSQD